MLHVRRSFETNMTEEEIVSLMKSKYRHIEDGITPILKLMLKAKQSNVVLKDRYEFNRLYRASKFPSVFVKVVNFGDHRKVDVLIRQSTPVLIGALVMYGGMAWMVLSEILHYDGKFILIFTTFICSVFATIMHLILKFLLKREDKTIAKLFNI
ncbi:MAG: hypothetical protein U0U67_12760 [Chitinophagales bacterium]